MDIFDHWCRNCDTMHKAYIIRGILYHHTSCKCVNFAATRGIIYRTFNLIRTDKVDYPPVIVVMNRFVDSVCGAMYNVTWNECELPKAALRYYDIRHYYREV